MSATLFRHAGSGACLKWSSTAADHSCVPEPRLHDAFRIKRLDAAGSGEADRLQVFGAKNSAIAAGASAYAAAMHPSAARLETASRTGPMQTIWGRAVV